jgi:hypothetical protein
MNRHALAYTLRQVETALTKSPDIDPVNLSRPDAEHAAQAMRVLLTLVNEAQLVVHIIQENTRDGLCTLRPDTTSGLGKAIESARTLSA